MGWMKKIGVEQIIEDMQIIKDPLQQMELVPWIKPHYQSYEFEKKTLYVPPDIWKIILSYLKDECHNCGGKICRECINNNVHNKHMICKTCEKIICPTQKTQKCKSCASELHKECYVFGSVKKATSSYFISDVCKPCFEKRRQSIISWDCIP